MTVTGKAVNSRMTRNYGLPYQGSKNRIATWVVDHLPVAPVLVDIMCGGGAVSHAAALSGKYGAIMLNDVVGTAEVFVDAVAGRYAEYNTVPTRDEFFAQKNDDIVMSLLYSFGNKRCDYLWSRDLEPVKVAASRALTAPTLAERQANWRAFCRALSEYVDAHGQLPANTQRLQGLEALGRLRELSSLSGHATTLLASHDDYRDMVIPDDAVVYVDPPYVGTRCEGYKDTAFDFDAFHDWLATTTNLTVISEYAPPPDCVSVASRERCVTMTPTGPRRRAVEHLFVPEHQLETYRAMMTADDEDRS